MEKMVIEGGHRLKGVININGAKNAALPILAACILLKGKSRIENVPDLTDVHTICEILKGLGLKIEHDRNNKVVEVTVEEEGNVTAPYKLVKKMRGSICVLGPLLSKRKKAKVSFPGGCVIGPRDIDLHIKGLMALGAKITVEGGYIVANTRRLKGTEIDLAGRYGSTVLGTCNVLMAAALAEGQTVILNAAHEPEVQDLANFLNKAGARIRGVGEGRIVVDGVKELRGVNHKIIPDRIEAATYMLAGAITNGEIILEGVKCNNLTAIVNKLRKIGATVINKDSRCKVTGVERFKPTSITTRPYPGMPTDVQAQFGALLTLADGISVIKEGVFPHRFMHVQELNRMGANIRTDGNKAIITGVKSLNGTSVMASDLRASASLVLAGLAANGITEVDRLYHIDRGYERIEDRLLQVGARVQRIKY